MHQATEHDDGAHAIPWNGNLRDLSMRVWSDDSDVAALVVVHADGHASGWYNLRLVGMAESRLVWGWIRHAAAKRPPADVLLARDLAQLRPCLSST